MLAASRWVTSSLVSFTTVRSITGGRTGMSKIPAGLRIANGNINEILGPIRAVSNDIHDSTSRMVLFKGIKAVIVRYRQRGRSV